MDNNLEDELLNEPQEDTSNNFQETFLNLENTIVKSIEGSSEYQSPINEILDSFQKFLEEKPEPPQEWLARLGEKASKYDYHQVVLPPEISDPYKTELENIDHIRANWGESSFMALDAQLVLRNSILYTDGHTKPIYAPKPLISLESIETDQTVDWDCCFSIYSDGSYYAYNMDKDDQEDISTSGLEFFKTYEEVIRYMNFHIPIEGYDYGFLKA